jgi:phosphodiesterase/alkaline phosphatase D-like protein
MKLPFSSTRRTLLGGAALVPLAACAPKAVEGVSSAKVAQGTFRHGVASGDPYADSVVLWTRLTPETDGEATVMWEVFEMGGAETVVKSGEVTTSAARDYTVKVVVDGLSPDTWYSYRFQFGDAVSPMGDTRTLPVGETARLRFAIASCANWQHGYFNTYDAIAKEARPNDPMSGHMRHDALIHLGDYYYEYGALETPRLEDRIHVPAGEIIVLDDYRTRHAQYRSDAALQSVTALMPLIAVWDDHETSNDSWQTGAENHQSETEGDWDARRQAALRAYYEWMPVREPKPGQLREAIYRNFNWGDLASLTCVETRLTARAEPIIVEDYIEDISAEGSADSFKENILRAPDREMFGPEQQAFIVDTLAQSKASGKPWRLIANQVIMGRLATPDFTPYIDENAVQTIEKDWPQVRDFLTLSKYNMPVYPDSWDGYPIAREKFYTALDAAGVNDMLVLTGDAHEFWVNELTAESGTKVGMELVTSSVSSQTLTAYMGDATADHNLLLTQSNADARYYNALNSGYIDLTLTPKKASVRMIAIDTVMSRNYTRFDTARFTLRPTTQQAKNTLKATSPKKLNFKQRLLFHGLG